MIGHAHGADTIDGDLPVEVVLVIIAVVALLVWLNRGRR